MRQPKILIAGLAMMVILAAAVFLLLRRPVTVLVNDQKTTLWTNALTVGGVLEDAGIAVNSSDLVQPALTEWLGGTSVVRVTQARQVHVTTPAGTRSFWSTARTPAEMLAQVEVDLASTDRLLWNGEPVLTDETLPEVEAYFFQVVPAVELTVIREDGSQTTLQTSGSLIAGLWQADIHLNRQDSLSHPPGMALTAPVSVVMHTARSVVIHKGKDTIAHLSSAATVGQALAEAGIALQGEDYSIPAEDQPLPDDGIIQVVTVREEIVIEQAGIPYKNDYVPDGNLELDQRQVIEPGLEGLQVSRVRVRIEDGLEVGRVKEATWVARQPKNAQVGYGTKIVIRTLQTPDGTIEYWRSFRVYATSYHPCGFKVCSYKTASGAPLKKGAIAVNEPWYPLLKGMNLYVDGYGFGTVVDWGRYINYWVDLGYSDEDFVNWHRYTTVYFLTPVPANVPYLLP